jgi:hypothetical protein
VTVAEVRQDGAEVEAERPRQRHGQRQKEDECEESALQTH